ncbi:MAG: hypothetical protein OEM98_11535 [Gammaproteobacteria bacterium]|nr:hypothetical protein [Gammaproteobacteria bacterium]
MLGVGTVHLHALELAHLLHHHQVRPSLSARAEEAQYRGIGARAQASADIEDA